MSEAELTTLFQRLLRVAQEHNVPVTFPRIGSDGRLVWHSEGNEQKYAHTSPGERHKILARQINFQLARLGPLTEDLPRADERWPDDRTD